MATKIKSGVIGTLDSNLVFADNSKAIFGAGSDLQIYHDGSNSFIADVGTGVLDIQTNGTEIQMTKAGAELMAKFVPDGAVTLYYDHSPKLATTSTGIDVTGTVVSTSNTATQFKNATDTDIQHKFETNSSSDFAIHRLIGSDGVDNKFIIGYGPNHPSTPNHIALKNTHASGSLGFNTGAASIERMRIDSSGRLLIGGTSATFGVLGVESSGNCTADFFSNSGSSTAAKTELFFSGGISGNSHVSFASIVAEQAAGNEATRKGQLRFLTANSGGPQTAMTIIANGNVGIAQPSPATTLHIGDGASHYVRIENAGSGDVSSGYQIYRGSSVGMSLYDNPADNMTSLLCAGGLNINAGGSGADLHVASNGKVGIGTTSPTHTLHAPTARLGEEKWLNSVNAYYISSGTINRNLTINLNGSAEYYIIIYIVGIWPYTASAAGTRIVEVTGYGATGNYHSVISNGGAGGQPTSVTVSASGGNLNLAINYNNTYRWNASAKVVYGANGMTMSVDGTNG